MVSTADVLRLTAINPETPRIVALGTNACVSHDKGVSRAIVLLAELLEPDSKEESGVWFALQVQPVDAMILARCILQVAEEGDWPEPDAEVIRTRVAGGETRH